MYHYKTLVSADIQTLHRAFPAAFHGRKVIDRLESKGKFTLIYITHLYGDLSHWNVAAAQQNSRMLHPKS